jgi:hypothetical protein
MKIFDNSIFDKKTFFQCFMALLAITVVQKFTRGEGYAVLMVPLALFSLAKNRIEQVMFWLVSSMLIIIGNQFFLPKGASFFIAQRALFGLIGLYAISKIAGRRQSRLVSPFLGMLIYLIYMTFTSFAGWNPTISLLKIFLFSLIYMTYYSVANMAGQSPRFSERKMRSIILAISSYFVFGSVAVLPFPAISQLTSEEYLIAMQSGQQVLSLFKGMSLHSQMLGPVVASIFALVLSDLVVNVRKANGLYLGLIIVCPFLIYKTSSRTAMAAFLMAVLMAGFCAMKMHGIGARWRGKVRTCLFAVMALLAVAVVSVPSLRDSIVRFALKYNAEAKAGDFTVEEAMSSRQGLIDRQLENFRRSPAIGNGFQVSEEHKFLKNASWKQLLSAPIEKGVWITAILEEGGLIGWVILVGFYAILCLTLLKRGAYTGLSVFCVMLVSNMAEFTMFSMSAMGGYTWCLVFVGTAMDAARIKRDNGSLMQENMVYYATREGYPYVPS